MTIQRYPLRPPQATPVLTVLLRIGLSCLLASAWVGLPAHAQKLKPSTQLNTSLLGQRIPTTVNAGQQPADFIVAIVNSEPITNNEVRQRISSVEAQINQQGGNLPPRTVLTREVLERLIQEKAQLQLAKETGLRVDDAAVDAAEQTLARRNQIDVAEFRRRMRAEGMTEVRFREELYQQVTLARLRERDVENRLRVSEQDIDQFIADEQSNVDPSRALLNLAQMLVIVPENANAAQVAALEARARRALERARAGEDFTALVNEYSDAPERAAGGVMGVRAADRYPTLFVEATQDLKTGGLSAVVRSGAGFHILKVIEKSQGGLANATVTQSRARHILLRASPELSETAAVEKLADFRRRIQAGKADFAALARDNSQDGSAKQGGDLGFVNPGSFVPEFEDVMNRLAPGDIAPPLVSRFGVHLIQLMERRETPMSVAEQRDVARAAVREKKLDEAYSNWAQEVRGRAYVELREPPESE
jgi:peptidyl-prolyl cis-trans isomerase SurA